MKYKVTITETLKRDVIIEADDQAEAEELADELASEGIIEIDSECFEGRECNASIPATDLDISLFQQFSRTDLNPEAQNGVSRELLDVVVYLQFENDTSETFPFATEYDAISEEQLSKITEILSNMDKYDLEDDHEACEQVLGINPMLKTDDSMEGSATGMALA